VRSSHISAAVDELVAEREHLVARLAKVDAAIVAVREAFHLPLMAARRPSTSSAAAKPSRNGNGRVGLSDKQITDALRAGPMSPGELSTQLGVERSRVRARLARLEAEGFVNSVGATSTRRIYLTSAAPAKEAP
jgi:DNA-binding transcriptional ArsR family regulator